MKTEDALEDMPKEREDIIQSKKATYEIMEVIGKGSFGAVFRVRRLEDGKELAMKCESYKVKKQILRHEARVLEGLRKVQSVHFISYEDRGKVTGRFMFVILRLLQCGFLHRDIKPPNFAIGREEDGSGHTIYILDFGLCRRYRYDFDNGNHQTAFY
ncbi:unnamed protein product [Angiostrongylus costaricensis]|uniref:Protein kinase domain-containing protein n=1 Tax=Angiostrongylus costaricensis TaxID=334426 RepID=A0A0R3PIU7_ANGCS|nr:unnamed protein product [Angiostrongylus costaricensis]